jgi:hypothetical protein
LHKYVINRWVRYETIREWKASDFKRLTGVRQKNFEKMLLRFNYYGLDVLERISLPISYSSYLWCWLVSNLRAVIQVEDALMHSREFTLLGKKALNSSDTLSEVILVDVGEQPIEHQKK